MSNYCSCCGSPIPDDQGSKTCSMCYGDPNHGKDGYYNQWIEDQLREEEYKQQQEQENN